MRMPSMKNLLATFRDLNDEDAANIRAIGRAADDQDALHTALTRDARLVSLAADVARAPMNRMWCRTYALRAMDVLLGTHGVEALTPSPGWHNGYGPAPYEYLNAGDAYAATLIYTAATDTVRIACWGDIAERFPSLDE
jgi:hypothetical protein